jgi:hypothetical protein
VTRPRGPRRSKETAAERRARVAALQAAVAAGRYEPDARVLADRLLARGVLSSEEAVDLTPDPDEER